MEKIKIISAAEARQRFAEITDEVRTQGTAYSIVRHGTEVARLVPPKTTRDSDVDRDLEKDIDEFFAVYKAVFDELAKR